MRKNFKPLSVLFYLALLTTFWGCSDKEDETSKLIGLWEHIQFEDTCGSLCADCDGATMQFFDNNQFTYINGDNDEVSGSYQLNNGIIIFSFDNILEEYTISFDQNTFTIVSTYQTVNETCTIFQTFMKVN